MYQRWPTHWTVEPPHTHSEDRCKLLIYLAYPANFFAFWVAGLRYLIPWCDAKGSFEHLIVRVFVLTSANRFNCSSLVCCASIRPSADEIVCQNSAHLVSIAFSIGVEPILLKLLQHLCLFTIITAAAGRS